jgi:hypothetical protein
METSMTQERITELESKNKLLSGEIEQLRVQLAGCGVAAMNNTSDSIKLRVPEGSYGWSYSYKDVCDAVDREIALRDTLEKARAGMATAIELLAEL